MRAQRARRAHEDDRKILGPKILIGFFGFLFFTAGENCRCLFFNLFFCSNFFEFFRTKRKETFLFVRAKRGANFLRFRAKRKNLCFIFVRPKRHRLSWRRSRRRKFVPQNLFSEPVFSSFLWNSCA